MKNVSPVGEPREGKEEFEKIDLKTYTQRVFSMFGGTQTRVTIKFINPLLDTVVDRFGTKGAIYMKMDDNHFTVNVPIEISNQFFSWVCGFSKKAKIISPQNVVDDYKKFLDEIRSMY